MDYEMKKMANRLVQHANGVIPMTELFMQTSDNFNYYINPSKEYINNPEISRKICHLLIQDPFGSQIIQRMKIKGIDIRPYIRHGQRIHTLPTAHNYDDVPICIAFSLCSNATAAGDLWSNRIKYCYQCCNFFVSKTKRGSQFCTPKCRWTHKNKKAATKAALSLESKVDS